MKQRERAESWLSVRRGRKKGKKRERRGLAKEKEEKVARNGVSAAKKRGMKFEPSRKKKERR